MITPASASSARVAGGSGSFQETSVVRSRGATSRPRSASASASCAASPAARSCTASQPAPPSTSSAASAAAEVSALCAEASWRAAVGARHRVQAGAGVLEVHVRRAGRRQRARSTAARSRASRCRPGRRATSGPSRRRTRSRARATSIGDGADALGAVEQHRHVGEVGEAGHDAPVDPAHVRARDELRLRTDGLGDLRERHGADDDARAGRAPRRAAPAGRGAPRRR